MLLTLKCKISAIRMVATGCISLIFLIATVKISMNVKPEAEFTKYLNLYKFKT